ncbi:MAG TPA: hypothetical protein VF944_04340 [Candidatus Bathyarchaeia archaeon]
MLTTICWLGVLPEAFRQTLGDCGGRLDVFRLWEESSSPDSVIFFQWFIGECFGIKIGRLRQFWGGFILLVISILYEGREWSSSTGIYPPNIFLLLILFFLPLSLATSAAAREASGHFDSSSTEVYLRIMLVEPGKAEDHTLLPKAGNRQQNVFGMSMVHHENVNNFVYASSLIGCSIYIVDWNRCRELAGWESSCGNEISVDKVSGCASVHHSFHRGFLHGVRCL